MTPRNSPEPAASPAQLIRNEPVQARSTARLTALLDAAALVVDRIGYERLTTAMVAEGADASIGTVYRYFPDRIAVLQALALRNIERLLQRLDEALDAVSADHKANWDDAMDAVFEVFTAMFRDEPGFASLRVGDVLDLRPVTPGDRAYDRVADRILEKVEERDGGPLKADGREAFRASVTVTDALVARAHTTDPAGDAGGLRFARDLLTSMMTPHIAA